MNSEKTAGFLLWCAVTIFVSAFLLFQVQPLASKMILPWFGGGPGIWTTCMLFFQVVLLLGYGYAHQLATSTRPMGPVIVHCVLLALAVLCLPITPSPAWKPADGTYPTYRILGLLAAKIGLPYFLLSSTGPLVQAWYARRFPGKSPYRLYALSNIGSLGALLTYPFVFEPAFRVPVQGWLWSGAFVVFALLCGGLAMATWHTRTAPEAGRGASQGSAFAGDRPPVGTRLAWVFLSALGSVTLLAVTQHVCQDVAVTPFLWIAPLALYLLTFIICFDNERWYLPRICAVVATVLIMAVAVKALEQPIQDALNSSASQLEMVPGWKALMYFLRDNVIKLKEAFEEITVEAGIYLAALFFICMLCHGELVRRKPSTSYLTAFYFMISAGGALGGIFVGLICPQLFSFNFELSIALVGGYMVAIVVLAEGARPGRESGSSQPAVSSPARVAPATRTYASFRMALILAAWLFAFGGMLLVVRAQFEALEKEALARTRNFYGQLQVRQWGSADGEGYRALYNGRIMHGLQLLDPSRHREPTSYYVSNSGIGVLMRRYHSDEPRRVAVVGLGTGTMATYINAGETVRFYEINPQVVNYAQVFFSYLEDCPGTVEIVPGDARLSMEREAPQGYDMIVLDAFSGDAIPAHLLTREAGEIYFKHLRETGVLAIHISNRHLELTPVVAGLARHFHRAVIKIDIHDEGGVADAASDWMLVTSNQEFLNDLQVRLATSDFSDEDLAIPLWTDQYSNLLQILK